MDPQPRYSTVLNNSGVACFQAGDLSSSLNLFREALQATISGLAPPDHGKGTSAPSAGSARAQAFGGLPAQESPSCTTEESVNTLHAYTRAINLIPQETAYAEDNLVNTTIESSIILFNLALVYHVKGLEGFDNSSLSMLLKARSLYLKAKCLLEEAGIPMDQSLGHQPVLDILIMAIHNNLGQSAYHLNEFDDSQSRFRDLSLYASSLKPERFAHDPETKALLEWHKSMFLMNAMTLQPPKLASAA